MVLTLVKNIIAHSDFLAAFLLFLGERKKFWLLPIVIMLALLGLFLVVTEGTAVAPFIYTLFLKKNRCPKEGNGGVHGHWTR